MLSSRRWSSIKALVSAAIVVGTALLSAKAHAQACCAGAAVGTGRLLLHEEHLVGIDVRATKTLGSFANDARYRQSSATQIQLEEGLFGSIRFLERGQASLRAPFVQSLYETTTRSELGGGLGDVQASGRYDFVMAGESLSLPGMALTAGVVAPTGRPVEKSKRLLGTDTTGTGAFQVSLGFGLEQTFDRVFVGSTTSASYRLPREVRGSVVPGSLQLSELLAVGWIFENEAVLVFSSLFTIEPEAPKRMLRLGLSFGLPFDDEWRMQGGLFSDLPIRHIGQNQTVGAGLQLAMMRSWS